MTKTYADVAAKISIVRPWVSKESASEKQIERRITITSRIQSLVTKKRMTIEHNGRTEAMTVTMTRMIAANVASWYSIKDPVLSSTVGPYRKLEKDIYF